MGQTLFIIYCNGKIMIYKYLTVNFLQFPRPYPSQYDLRGESFTCYGSDFRGCITYKFNNQGFRSDFDYDLTDNDSLLVCLGSSIGTGHGLEIDQTFGHHVAKHCRKKLWNLGQGCFRSSNQTMLEQLEFLTKTNIDIGYYVLQFTHINRMGTKSNSYLELDNSVAVKNFTTTLEKISKLLHGKRWCWLLCDYAQNQFPQEVINHPNKIVIDPDSMDFIEVENYKHLAPTQHALKMLSLHPGAQWNQHIANLIIEYFDEHQ
jgi:hypothetical protein